MRIINHPSLSLPIVNLDSICEVETNRQQQRHGELLPNTIRAVISGPSGCGKTNLLLSLLFGENGLRFENIYIFSKTLYQPKYEFLNKVISNIPEIEIFNYSNNDEIIDPQDAKTNSIFIFDDVVCDKQNNIRSYFSRGRHNLIDSLFLSQTYTKIAKHLIRDNANVIVLYRQDEINLRHVFAEHVDPDMKFTEFKDMCSKCWNGNKYNCIVIIKDFPLEKGRYRIGFDKYIYLDDYKS